MPRPVDSAAPSSPSAAPSPLCERIQQFRERMRSRCLGAASGSDATENSAIPCLLQSWRKRIEAMDDEPQQQTHSRHHRGHRHFGHHHRRPCHAAAAESSATESDASSSPSPSPPPTCGGFPFRGGPRMLHPRLERQHAVCSLSGIWSGFTSSSSSLSPPPSPEIYAKPRHRRHPYARCFGRVNQDSDADDHRKSSSSEEE